MGTTVKTNPSLNRLIEDLRALSRESGAPLWRDLAERLARRKRHWSEVNLSRVSRTANDGETVVVHPGEDGVARSPFLPGIRSATTRGHA